MRLPRIAYSTLLLTSTSQLWNQSNNTIKQSNSTQSMQAHFHNSQVKQHSISHHATHIALQGRGGRAHPPNQSIQANLYNETRLYLRSEPINQSINDTVLHNIFRLYLWTSDILNIAHMSESFNWASALDSLAVIVIYIVGQPCSVCPVKQYLLLS